MDSSTGNLTLNWPQRNFFFHLSRGTVKDARLVWGRGTAKSSSIALLIREIVRTMPRSNWVIQGATFQQLLTRTLPGTLAFLEKIGFKRDRDYFINKYPPKGYSLPYECPLKPENVIFFVNHRHKYSVAFTLFSQDRSSGRGPNRDGIICDESLLLDYEKFTSETLATNRGNDIYYQDVKLHHGVFHFSSMPSGMSWLLEGGEYYDHTFDYQNIRNQMIALELEFCRNKDKADRMEIWRQRIDLATQLQYKPSESGMFYSEFDSFDNIENLSVRYLDDLYRDTPELIFAIEILNKRTNKIEDSFYPALSREKHCYKGHYDYSLLDNYDFDFDKLTSLNSQQDLDCNPDLPLDIGMDFGVHINWLVVGQEVRNAGRLQFNFIKNFYVKTPGTIDDVVKNFCDYYTTHKKKVVYLWPDAEGNVRRPNVQGQSTYVDQIVKLLRSNGWSVIVNRNLTKNALTVQHYITWARCLAEDSATYPIIRFNLIGCKELIYSMEQTPALDSGSNDIRKNKASEKSLKDKREQATDAGDAADKIITGKYGSLNRNYSYGTVAIGA
jgi:hypothetical protein